MCQARAGRREKTSPSPEEGTLSLLNAELCVCVCVCVGRGAEAEKAGFKRGEGSCGTFQEQGPDSGSLFGEKARDQVPWLSDGISKLEALLGSDQRSSVTGSNSHGKPRTELGWNSGPRNPRATRVLVCPSVCILRGRGGVGGDWQDLCGGGEGGRGDPSRLSRWGREWTLVAGVGPRGMAKGTSREKQ